MFLISYPGPNPVYMIIRDALTAQVWNGSALVPWADADIGQYAIYLTSEGGDVYVATPPANMPSGKYLVQFRAQTTGDTPSPDDLILRSDTFRHPSEPACTVAASAGTLVSSGQLLLAYVGSAACFVFRVSAAPGIPANLYAHEVRFTIATRQEPDQPLISITGQVQAGVVDQSVQVEIDVTIGGQITQQTTYPGHLFDLVPGNVLVEIPADQLTEARDNLIWQLEDTTDKLHLASGIFCILPKGA